MTQLADLAPIHNAGASLLKEIHSTSLNALIDLGFPKSEATTLKRLADSYYGPCTTPSLQERAVAAARANRHSLATLQMIRTVARKRLDGGHVFELILEFCSIDAPHDVIEKTAKRRVEDINRTVKDRKQKAYGRRSAVSSAQPTADGLKSLLITGPADDIDRITHALRRGARQRMKNNRKLFKSQANYDELIHQFFGTATASEKVHQVIVPISLEDYHRVMDGDGDDVRVACSDGQILTGTELINSRLADDIYIGLVHPVEGPSNLYRTRRLANSKQRILAKAENPICPAPDCRSAADDCEIHHLTAWNRGGNTNMADLASVCPTDNGRNDDDPDQPRNGRFDRIDGRIYWTPVDGEPVRNDHPAAEMGLMDLV